MSPSLPSPILPLLLYPPAMLIILALTVLAIVLSFLFFSKKRTPDIVVAATTAASTTITNTSSVQPLPPSPPKFPIIGNLHQLGSNPHRSLHSLSEHYGALMLLHFGRLPVLVASSASIVREITQTHDHHFANRPSLKATSTLLYHGHDIAFAPYGDYWRETKKATILHLLTNKKVGSNKQVREEELTIMMKEIERTILVDLTRRFNALSMNVISRAVIGESTRNKLWGDGLRRLICESSSLIGEFYIGDYIPWLGKIVGVVSGFEGRLRNAFERSDKLLEGIVKEHMKQIEKRKGEGGDGNAANACFLDVLLTLEEEFKCKGIVFDSESIKAIVKDLFAAGTDSISISMEWTMAELLRHPTAMKKLKEEIIRVAGLNKTIIKEEQLADMSYLKAAVKEALRLHPPGVFVVPRQAIHDNTHIKGYRIPKGTMVLINAWAIGRDPKIWESPEEFRPERFINGEARGINFNSHGFQLLAFGAGRRSCPGIQFSVTLIELAIANLVYAFDWKPAKGKIEDIDMDEVYGFNTRKREALVLLASKAVK